MNSSDKKAIKQYLQFLPDVLSNIVLEYVIFSTQEIFINSTDDVPYTKMIREKNMIYEYCDFKKKIKKDNVNTIDMFIYSDNILIHEDLIYVVDDYYIKIFNKECKKIDKLKLTEYYTKIFIHDDEIYKCSFFDRKLQVSKLYKICIDPHIFDAEKFSLKYANESIYILLWNNCIIKYSIEYNTYITVHKYDIHCNRYGIKSFCVDTEHIYILRTNSIGPIEVYDHNTNLIRYFAKECPNYMNTISCCDNIVYVRDESYKVHIYEIRHKSIFSKD